MFNLINPSHLRQVEETYVEHAKFGLWAAAVLLLISVLSFVHAIFPFLFSRWPIKLYNYFVLKSNSRLHDITQTLQHKGLK